MGFLFFFSMFFLNIAVSFPMLYKVQNIDPSDSIRYTKVLGFIKESKIIEKFYRLMESQKPDSINLKVSSAKITFDCHDFADAIVEYEFKENSIKEKDKIKFYISENSCFTFTKGDSSLLVFNNLLEPDFMVFFSNIVYDMLLVRVKIYVKKYDFVNKDLFETYYGGLQRGVILFLFYFNEKNEIINVMNAILID